MEGYFPVVRPGLANGPIPQGEPPDVVLAMLRHNRDLEGSVGLLRRQLVPRGLVVLSDSGGVEGPLAAFAAGADDYLPVPFDARELLARLQALLRRLKGENAGAAEGIYVDVAARRVTIDGQEVALTHREFELLHVLLRNRGVVLSKSQLLDLVWGYQGHDPNVVEVRVSALRRKLGEAGNALRTVRGYGYVLR